MPLITEKNQAMLMSAVKNSGVFVTSGIKDANVMVTHQGLCGKMWGKDVFALPIKAAKRSYELIQKTGVFALCVPARDMRHEIARCDTLSGYKVDKFEELHLHVKKARAIHSVILGECGLIVECRVIALHQPQPFDKELFKAFYGEGERHELFYGEIVDSYNLR